jgi:hypothetical protein
MSACLLVVKTTASRLTYRRLAEFSLDLAVFVAARPDFAGQTAESTPYIYGESS